MEGGNMSCEYSNIKNNKCSLTGKICLMDNDVDKTAYRHCLRREWKARLDDRHSVHLQRPCSSLADIVPEVCHRTFAPDADDCVGCKDRVCKTPLGLGGMPSGKVQSLGVDPRLNLTFVQILNEHAENTLTMPPPSLTNL